MPACSGRRPPSGSSPSRAARFSSMARHSRLQRRPYWSPSAARTASRRSERAKKGSAMRILLVSAFLAGWLAWSSYSAFFARYEQRRLLKVMRRDSQFLRKRLPWLMRVFDWWERYVDSDRYVFQLRISGCFGYLVCALLAFMLVTGRVQ